MFGAGSPSPSGVNLLSGGASGCMGPCGARFVSWRRSASIAGKTAVSFGTGFKGSLMAISLCASDAPQLCEWFDPAASIGHASRRRSEQTFVQRQPLPASAESDAMLRNIREVCRRASTKGRFLRCVSAQASDPDDPFPCRLHPCLPLPSSRTGTVRRTACGPGADRIRQPRRLLSRPRRPWRHRGLYRRRRSLGRIPRGWHRATAYFSPRHGARRHPLPRRYDHRLQRAV